MNTWFLAFYRHFAPAEHKPTINVLTQTVPWQENDRKANEEIAELTQQAKITEADLKAKVTCVCVCVCVCVCARARACVCGCVRMRRVLQRYALIGQHVGVWLRAGE